MEISLTYKQISELEPEATKTLCKRMTENLLANPENFKWKLSWGVEQRSESFSDILSAPRKTKEDNDKQLAKTVDERLAEIRPNISGVCVYVSHNRRRNSLPIKKPSSQLIDFMIEQHRKITEEMFEYNQRILAMSEQERHEETARLLSQLAGTPGFVIVHRQ
jgi:hypothetical protein